MHSNGRTCMQLKQCAYFKFFVLDICRYSLLFSLFIIEATNLASKSLRRDFTTFSSPFICRQGGSNPDINVLVFGLTDSQINDYQITQLSPLTSAKARERPGTFLSSPKELSVF